MLAATFVSTCDLKELITAVHELKNKVSNSQESKAPSIRLSHWGVFQLPRLGISQVSCRPAKGTLQLSILGLRISLDTSSMLSLLWTSQHVLMQWDLFLHPAPASADLTWVCSQWAVAPGKVRTKNFWRVRSRWLLAKCLRKTELISFDFPKHTLNIMKWYWSDWLFVSNTMSLWLSRSNPLDSFDSVDSVDSWGDCPVSLRRIRLTPRLLAHGSRMLRVLQRRVAQSAKKRRAYRQGRHRTT